MATPFRQALTACLGVLIAPMTLEPAGAQGLGGRNAVVTQLPAPVLEDLRRWLGRRGGDSSAPPRSDFKVPGLTRTEIICRIGPGGLRCFESLIGLQCPSVVEVELPNGARTTAGVNCTGPDRDGTCDCEFVSG